MTCSACADNRAGKHGSYRAGCLECAARSLARGPLFHAAQQAGAITKEYRAALDRAFKGDIQRGHEMVKRCAAEDLSTTKEKT